LKTNPTVNSLPLSDPASAALSVSCFHGAVHSVASDIQRTIWYTRYPSVACPRQSTEAYSQTMEQLTWRAVEEAKRLSS